MVSVCSYAAFTITPCVFYKKFIVVDININNKLFAWHVVALKYELILPSVTCKQYCLHKAYLFDVFRVLFLSFSECLRLSMKKCRLVGCRGDGYLWCEIWECYRRWKCVGGEKALRTVTKCLKGNVLSTHLGVLVQFGKLTDLSCPRLDEYHLNWKQETLSYDKMSEVHKPDLTKTFSEFIEIWKCWVSVSSSFLTIVRFFNSYQNERYYFLFNWIEFNM